MNGSISPESIEIDDFGDASRRLTGLVRIVHSFAAIIAAASFFAARRWNDRSVFPIVRVGAKARATRQHARA